MDLPIPGLRRTATADVAGQVVLITGAAGALGSATAAKLAASGARLALADRDQQAVEALAEHLGRGATACACDVLDDADVDRLVGAVTEQLGPVDVFVSAAGVEINAAYATVTRAEIDVQLGLHLRSPMLLVSLILPCMLARRRGRIVIVSSMSGKVPLPVKAPYAAAKAGAIAFSHSLRRELAGTGVTVSVVTPGVVSGAGQAHRALSNTSVQVPRTLGAVTTDQVADAIVGVLASGAAEVAVQAIPPAVLNALQAAAPEVADRVLRLTGIGEFWRAVARENGRA